MKKLSALLLFLLSYVACFAQENAAVDMAFDMRKEGKIYVVIVTIVIIFAGLSVYLFSIDRRLKKIEKEK
ncbi:CcmD family protein [Mucilaginibacter auburnensis]|uniref:CcmD family protein n=1 Tax=Mucilaginibacter auburnensis TaxID=1457233 RepID=A0A2H9VM54_9SPHI|nr:CcmD family protein [Mucilaginibacter auburnensis]PJJ79419.1 CcmD family protein [Mucilaginibacter auburnensis]